MFFRVKENGLRGPSTHRTFW